MWFLVLKLRECATFLLDRRRRTTGERRHPPRRVVLGLHDHPAGPPRPSAGDLDRSHRSRAIPWRGHNFLLHGKAAIQSVAQAHLYIIPHTVKNFLKMTSTLRATSPNSARCGDRHLTLTPRGFAVTSHLRARSASADRANIQLDMESYNVAPNPADRCWRREHADRDLQLC